MLISAVSIPKWCFNASNYNSKYLYSSSLAIIPCGVRHFNTSKSFKSSLTKYPSINNNLPFQVEDIANMHTVPMVFLKDFIHKILSDSCLL